MLQHIEIMLLVSCFLREKQVQKPILSVSYIYAANLRSIYTCEFHMRFHIKLAHFVTKKIFITKCASLVQNCP